MINGVLVERTVKDVMPQLQTNAEGLKKVLDDLLKQYTSKQEELEKWKVNPIIAQECLCPNSLLTHVNNRNGTRSRLFNNEYVHQRRHMIHQPTTGECTRLGPPLRLQ